MAHGIAQRYDRILAMRPDGVLTRPLHIERSCRRHPGLNIISGFTDKVAERLGQKDRLQLQAALSGRGEGDDGGSSHNNAGTMDVPQIKQSAWDMGLLACEPKALNRWLYGVFNRSVGMCGTVERPRRPDVQYELFSLTACPEEKRSKNGLTGHHHLTRAVSDLGPQWAADAKKEEVEKRRKEEEEVGCASRQLFDREDTKPARFRLGNLDESNVYLMALDNRTDQGWWWRPLPEVCPAQQQKAVTEPLSNRRLGDGGGGGGASSRQPPHLVLILVDDLGFNGVGYRNQQLHTPTIDALANSGVRLESFYTAPVCGPSRAALMTGRMPHKLQASVDNFAFFWREEGISLNYTLLPALLKSRFNYATAGIGKWHGGHARTSYLPTHRGFDSFYGLLGGCSDHISQRNCCPECDRKKYPGVRSPVDLHRDGYPALNENGSAVYSHNGLRWSAAAVERIRTHAETERAVAMLGPQSSSSSATAPSSRRRSLRHGVMASIRPLFLYVALQDPHAPYQTPQRFEDLYSHHTQRLRRVWSGMISSIDETVLNITSALKDEGMWQRTLLLFASDNGSPIGGWGAGGSNHPLRGGKGSLWEGGVRTPAFVNGGLLSLDRMRGKRLDGFVHITDLFSTFCSFGGGALHDAAAQDETNNNNPSLPTVDSLDMRPYFLGKLAASPRNLILHRFGRWMNNKEWIEPDKYSAITYQNWKLLVGEHTQAEWFGHFAPYVNDSGVKALEEGDALMRNWQDARSEGKLSKREIQVMRSRALKVNERVRKSVYGGNNAAFASSACTEGAPCLFDIRSDPEERHDLAASKPEKVKELMGLLEAERVEMERRPPMLKPAVNNKPAFCTAAMRSGGFLVPWMPPPGALPPAPVSSEDDKKAEVKKRRRLQSAERFDRAEEDCCGGGSVQTFWPFVVFRCLLLVLLLLALEEEAPSSCSSHPQSGTSRDGPVQDGAQLQPPPPTQGRPAPSARGAASVVDGVPIRGPPVPVPLAQPVMGVAAHPRSVSRSGSWARFFST